MNYTVSKPIEMGCYTQPIGYLKTMTAAKAALGADVIVNFELFNSDYTHALAFKLNGKVLANDGSNYWGYAWNNGDTKLQLARVYAGMDRYANFAGGVMVLKAGKPITNPEYGGLFPGVRGRTCIGRKANGDIELYFWKDGSAGACSIAQLGAKMAALGCVDAINYDGGGSVQGSTPEGSVYSNRLVASFLWFKLPKVGASKPTAPSATTPTPQVSKPAMGGAASKNDILEEGYSRMFYGKLGTTRKLWAEAHGMTYAEFQQYINQRWPGAPRMKF